MEIVNKKRMKVFELNDPLDLQAYEKLMNDPMVKILEKDFKFLPNGSPKIAVWWIEEVEE